MASGTWLQYLDADDYLLPAQDRRARREWLTPTTTWTSSLDRSRSSTVQNGQARSRDLCRYRNRMIRGSCWRAGYLPQTGAPLWRKSAIEEVGGWAPITAGMPGTRAVPAAADGRQAISLSTTQTAPSIANGARALCGRADKAAHPPAAARDRGSRSRHFCASASELTPERHWAINMARFETARSAWQDDRAEALAIIERESTSRCPAFMPAGRAAPPRYQQAYRWLGFAATETIAACARRVASALQRHR